MTSRYVRTDGAVEPAFASLMARLAQALGATVTEERIRSYAQILGDLPWADLVGACARLARERQSGRGPVLPTPGDLRAYVVPPVEDRALLAWAALGRAAAEAGAYATLEFEDGAAAEALRVVYGSWPAYCAEEDGPGMAQRRQEFLAAYRAASHRGCVGVVRMPGLCDAGADPALACRTWVARLTAAGVVEHQRDGLLLGPGTEQAALLEAKP